MDKPLEKVVAESMQKKAKEKTKRHTKIVCTIGPSVDSPERLDALIAAGMDIARLNFSHGSHSEHGKRIMMLKAARKRAEKGLAIMLDTKGPEIRIGAMDKTLSLKEGDALVLTSHENLTTKDRNQWQELFMTDLPIAGSCLIEPACVVQDLSIGNQVLFDDGKIGSTVLAIEQECVLLRIDNKGELSSRKGVNIPSVSLSLEALTEKDKADIRFGIECQVDLIAASFVRSGRHMREIKALIRAEGADIPVLAKIENQEGVDHFDEILQESDGIMIARGDLGVELPLSQVPNLQKMMIRKTYLAGKPSITATQMLESMVEQPRPTRAEVSDVANAIYDSTSAVMLSGETAMGRYPIEVVELMSQVIEEAEKHAPFDSFVKELMDHHIKDVGSCIALAAVKTAQHSDAKAIFSFSRTGRTARLISRLRPFTPVLAYTSSDAIYHQLSLCWGVIPFLGPEIGTIDEGFNKMAAHAQKIGLLEHGDTVITTAGIPFGKNAATNLMMLECIGDVLFKAGQGYGKEIVSAPFIIDEGQKKELLKGKAVLVTHFTQQCSERLREAKAIILENDYGDLVSPQILREFAQTYEVSILWNAFGAKTALKKVFLSDKAKKSPWVRVDPHKRLILAT